MKIVFKEIEDRLNTMEEHAIWDRNEREYFVKNIKPQLMKRLKEIQNEIYNTRRYKRIT